MKKLGLLVGTVALVACQTKPNANQAYSNDYRQAGRAPTSDEAHSDHTEEEVDNIYAAFMRQPDPAGEMTKFIVNLKSLFYRAESRVHDFDAMVAANDEKEFDLMTSPSYQKVLTMRLVREKLEDKIVFLYDHLKTVVSASDEKSADRNEAEKVLKVFDANLSSTNRADEIIFHDLKLRLMHHGFRIAHAPLKLTTNAAFQKMALAVGVKEEQKNDALSDEIKATEQELHESIELTVPDRNPQSARIEPSTGSGGTISGSNFPSGDWALTYDDGPHPSYTLQDVANLQANGAQATFFWLAKNTGLYPNVVKGVVTAGFPVEDHSWNHPQLNNPKDIARQHSTLKHEIIDSSNAEAAQYGAKPRFFRCPYGAGINSSAVRQMIASQGMINVFWNVDSLDWQDHNPASILARTQKQMAAQKRGIILFHDIHPQSIEASRMLMQAQKGKVNWVTIPEIVDRLNGGT